MKHKGRRIRELERQVASFRSRNDLPPELVFESISIDFERRMVKRGEQVIEADPRFPVLVIPVLRR